MKHLVSPLDFSVPELESLLALGEKIMDNPEQYAHCCAGKKLATLFFEPSTRTRLSFEAAMLDLGGSVLSVSSAASSSASIAAMPWEISRDAVLVSDSLADVSEIGEDAIASSLEAATFDSRPNDAAS